MCKLSELPVLFRTLAISAAAALLAPLHIAFAAPVLQTLHGFCHSQGCTDGADPNGLLQDAAGNLYGTTQAGGKLGYGLVFKLVPNGDGTYKEYILHNFCSRSNCLDGYQPEGDLILDVDGSLYGTTNFGGSKQSGTIFKLTHKGNGWALKVLHNFCTQFCAAGSLPVFGLSYLGQSSGAPWDKSTPLFGTTPHGGQSDNGVVYELVTDGSVWTYQVVHKFSSGQEPNAVLVDPGGNLYGTTYAGGKYFGGQLYKLAAGSWKAAVLHNFCVQPNCADGRYPYGKLFMDAAGNLFGTTSDGGLCWGTGNPCGVAFERPATGEYDVIYKFCFLTGCLDGSEPDGNLTMDGSGHLFGTTFTGGANSNADCTQGCGTVFQLTNNGGRWSETVLYSFCSLYPCGDGGLPGWSVLLDQTGALLGTTSKYGPNDKGGTVFRLTP
jgi:uncharacterized repeat protein (TIGR03803 family)